MENLDNIEGYLISKSAKETDDEFFFKLMQMPENWFLKAGMLHKDANILYANFEKMRSEIVKNLEKRKFNFQSFSKDEIEEQMHNILSNNSDLYLSTFETFYLLIGFSFENALKGIYLSQNISQINSKKISQSIVTHDLAKLLTLTNINLTEDEYQVLNKVSGYLIGYGRYPIRKKVKTSNGIQNLDFGCMKFLECCLNCINNPYKEDKFIIDNIWDVISSVMDNEMKSYHINMGKVFGV